MVKEMLLIWQHFCFNWRFAVRRLLLLYFNNLLQYSYDNVIFIGIVYLFFAVVRCII